MELKNKHVLIAAQYAAPYAGNFIPSLQRLATKLIDEGAKVSFVFPQNAARYEWSRLLKRDYRVYFTGDESSLVNQKDLETIPVFDLIYSHFEGYDTVFLKFMPNTTKFVWHMHDTLNYQKNIIKKIYQVFSFYRHYGIPFINHDISLIYVNDHEKNFVRSFRACKIIHETTIPNGIDFSRIRSHHKRVSSPFIFLAYGGRNIQKRIDLVFKAGEMLTNVIGGGGFV